MIKIILKSILFSLVFTFYCSFSYSQINETWAMPLHPAKDSASRSVNIALDDSGNIFVIGEIWDIVGQNADCIVGRHDPLNGVVLWFDIFGDTSDIDRNFSISIDHNSNIYVTSFLSTLFKPSLKTIKFNSSGIQQWIIGNTDGGGKNIIRGSNLYVIEGNNVNKYDLDGVLKWNSSIITPSAIAADAFVVLDKIENVYVIGANTISANPPFEKSIVSKKYDSSGTFLWERTYHPTTGMDNLYSIAMDDSANLYVFGTQDWQYNPAYTLVKYDSAGNRKWATSYSATPQATGNSIAVDNNHNVYVCGETSTSNSSDYSIIKYDINGNLKWIVKYDSATTAINSLITLDSYGNIYFTCEKGLSNKSDIATLKLDSAGNILWEIRYNQFPTGPERPSGMVVDKYGSVYVTGTSGNQLITIRYDQVTGISVPEKNLRTIRVYPNPFFETINLYIPDGQNSGGMLKIYNLIGEKVYEAGFPLSHGVISVDLPFLKKGMYYINVYAKDQFYTEKVIKSY